MTTLPTGLVALLGLAGPFVAVVAIVADWLKALGRQKHERAMRLRDERLRAYAVMARVTKLAEASEPFPLREVAEAHAEIELLAEDPRLREEADLVVQAAAQAWQIARAAHDKGIGDPYSAPQARRAKEIANEHRNTFIQLAKEELGQKPTRVR